VVAVSLNQLSSDIQLSVVSVVSVWLKKN
jgi:hypothetical protein